MAASGSDATRGLGSYRLLAAAIVAQQVASKALRDGLFLARVSAAELPRAMLFGALLSGVAVLGTSIGLARFGPRRAAVALLALNGVLFGFERTLLPASPILTAWLLYVHVAALGGTTISAFFSNLSEQFDPHHARLASGRVIGGAAIGGMLGGLVVTLLARNFGHPRLLVLLALLNLGCALALALLPGREPPHQPAHTGLSRKSLITPASGYLRSIAYLVLLTGFTSALLDFSFKQEAAASVGGGPELLQLFAAFHTGTAIVTALVQLTLAQTALERLGLAGTLAVLPASLLLGGALGPLLPRLWSTLLLRGASSVFESSLFRSAYEPLFTPLSQRARRSLKTLIDVAAGRLGEGAGSVALLSLAWLWPSAQVVPVVAIALLAAAVTLFLSLRMHSAYVDALAISLRNGSVRLHEGEVVDSTTRLTLSQTHVELERAQLLAEIAAQRASKPPPPPVVEDAQSEQLLGDARALLSADRERVTQLFARGPLDVRLVPFAIALLREAAWVAPVSEALVPIVDRVVGQLVDALLDPTQPQEVRRRLPRILRNAREPRAAEGLLAALHAPERLLRQRAANALAVLTARQPELAPRADSVFELVRRELREGRSERASLPHLFALLSLTLDREAVNLAREAFLRGDARQRGTALEYLHSTLPEPVRSELMTCLEAIAATEA